jgi:hypothetical protein
MAYGGEGVSEVFIKIAIWENKFVNLDQIVRSGVTECEGLGEHCTGILISCWGDLLDLVVKEMGDHAERV